MSIRIRKGNVSQFKKKIILKSSQTLYTVMHLCINSAHDNKFFILKKSPLKLKPYNSKTPSIILFSEKKALEAII